jgi:hypothetical protein
MCKATAGAVLILQDGNDADSFGAEESEAFAYAVTSSVVYATNTDGVTVKNVRTYADYYANQQQRGLLAKSTASSTVLVNYTLEIVLEESGFYGDAADFHDALLIETIRAFTDGASDDSFMFHIEWFAKENAIMTLFNASIDTNATIAVLYALYDTNLYASAQGEEPVKQSFWEDPFTFEYTMEEAELAASVASVAVAAAVVSSVAASVGSSVGASMASSGGSSGAQGGDGDVMSLIFTVQFMAIITQLNFPAEDTFVAFGSAFSWVNLQLRLPLPFRCAQAIIFVRTHRCRHRCRTPPPCTICPGMTGLCLLL